jgi:hypothetical protein
LFVGKKGQWLGRQKLEKELHSIKNIEWTKDLTNRILSAERTICPESLHFPAYFRFEVKLS